ncbi:acyl-protein synthetase LuxE [Leptospira perolatii]|uniref:Acyl-protein synthetase LuxE n=2 Tax=Leptospira perolatii TaxID=2023191 RepID=A0A2M9ZQX0_9LEPT|nr:acyl-protein synthetase LuxE [Leptospira perolatii]PJZ74476.1 acyl-protein synthetase LuxE [Leptospira perolatii]
MTRSAALELKLAALSDSLKHHSENCKEFGDYCERKSFDPWKELYPQDLASIPQIPTSAFKVGEILSVPSSQIIRRFESSGTSGTRSKILRDEITLARLSGSLRSSAEVWSDVIGDRDLEDDIFVIHLGPSRKDAGTVWFGYVMSLIELEAETEHMMKNGKVDLHAASALIRSALQEGKRVLVVGAPFLVEELCKAFQNSPICAGSNLFLLTGGGWKKNISKAISQSDLASLAAKSFGIDSPSQLRDVFNQVELNSAFVQCSEGRLHSPPWVEVIVRDPLSWKPLDSGQIGLLTYLDPTAHSYPGFIAGEDLGSKEEHACSCGRTTQSIRIVRRLNVSSHQGCSLQLQEKKEEKSDKDKLGKSNDPF